MINVKTGEFYGPFDVLLDLIETSKVDIYDISISEITSEYIERINNIQIPADELTDFIVIAATLLHIKTRYLIKDSIEEDTEEEISREELIRRLVEYKRIKATLPFMRELEASGNMHHFKLQEDLSYYNLEVEDEISFDLDKIKAAIEAIIYKNEIKEEFKVERILNIEEYSLEEYSKDIETSLIKKKFINISKMLKKVSNKSEAIIIFLSILELSKKKELSIEQDPNTFEIIVKHTGESHA